MTDIERKALAMVNEVEEDRRLAQRSQFLNRKYNIDEALCRAIEQHEAFRQEVSDAIEAWWYDGEGVETIKRFIIAKPDPLVEIIATALREGSPFDEDGSHDYTAEAKVITAALAKRGLEIREKSDD